MVYSKCCPNKTDSNDEYYYFYIEMYINNIYFILKHICNNILAAPWETQYFTLAPPDGWMRVIHFVKKNSAPPK